MNNDDFKKINIKGEYENFEKKTEEIKSLFDNIDKENIWGLNVNVNDSASDQDNDGYTNIEEYLHYLSANSYTFNSNCMPMPVPTLK